MANESKVFGTITTLVIGIVIGCLLVGFGIIPLSFIPENEEPSEDNDITLNVILAQNFSLTLSNVNYSTNLTSLSVEGRDLNNVTYQTSFEDNSLNGKTRTQIFPTETNVTLSEISVKSNNGSYFFNGSYVSDFTLLPNNEYDLYLDYIEIYENSSLLFYHDISGNIGNLSSNPEENNPEELTPKTEGYIILPSIYNTLSNSLSFIIFENNGTSNDLDLTDNRRVNMTTNGSGDLQFGWNLNLISNDMFDVVNATINMSLYSNASFTMELLVVSQNLTGFPHQSWVNLTINQGFNSFDNLTIIGSNGFVENITSGINDYPLICTRNCMFVYKIRIPTNISFELDQIVCRFYGKNLHSELYTQFFN